MSSTAKKTKKNHGKSNRSHKKKVVQTNQPQSLYEQMIVCGRRRIRPETIREWTVKMDYSPPHVEVVMMIGIESRFNLLGNEGIAFLLQVGDKHSTEFSNAVHASSQQKEERLAVEQNTKTVEPVIQTEQTAHTNGQPEPLNCGA